MTSVGPTVGRPSEVTTGWGDNPWAAFAVRTAVFLTPIALSFSITWFLARQWTAPPTVPLAIIRFLVLAAVAIVIGAASDKGARRFLPLAALFRLSLVFPDQAPSRFAVALRSGNTRQISQRLAEVESGGFRGNEVEAAQLIVEFAASLSNHDRLTRGHSERVRAYTALIAEEMGLSAEDSNKLQWAGLIHDVGKLRIPQEILAKPGNLTPEEFEVIKTHPAEGMRLAAPLADYLGPWIGAVGEHHERFDGGGYPNGLSGTDISLAGRIVAVADAYDVITAARSYKKPLTPAFAREELARNAGSQFDPVVVRAFMSISLGRLRRAMWPLSWAVQVPFMGTAITAPIAQTVAATVITLATATGVAATNGGFDVLTAPEAIAMVDNTGRPDPTNVGGQATGTDPDRPSEVAVGPTTSAPGNSEPGANPVITTTTLPSSSELPPAGAIQDTQPPGADAEPGQSTTTSTTATSTTTNSTATTSTTSAPLSDCDRAQSGDAAQQNADLRNCDLSALNFTSANFDGANLSGAVLEDVDLINSTFVGASFDHAELIGVDAQGSDFTRATFVSTDFVDGFLTGSNLNNTTLSNARFTDMAVSSTFVDANLDGVTITRAGFAGSTMNDATMRNSSVSQASFPMVATGLDADGSSFFEVSFENATLTNSSFVGVDFQFGGFVTAQLASSDFTRSKLINANFYGATVSGADFGEAELRNINMDDLVAASSDFTGARMTGGSMVSATLQRSAFTNAVVTSWDFNGASMNQANFNGAIFADSSLQSVDAEGAAFVSTNFGSGGLWIFNAVLRNANFSNATGFPGQPETGNYDSTTCPDGVVRSESCW